MADPLSISASLFGLASLATSVVQNVFDFHKAWKSDPIEVLELNVYVDLLYEIREYPLLKSQDLPRAVESSTRLCHERLQRLESFIAGFKSSKGSKKPPLGSKDAEKALGGFMRSVNILRDVVMDATTHKLLQDQQSSYHNHLEMIRNELTQEIEYLRAQVGLVEQGLSLDSEQHRTGLSDLADRLRSMTESNTSRTTDWRPDSTDHFSFSATILSPRVEDSEYAVARGKFDTGCDENWISMEVLHRAGVGGHIDSVENKHSYVAFGGQEFEPLGKIEVTWYAENAGKSRKTSFLVHHEVPFDMVLGRIFIAEESIFMFNKPALALRMGKFTKEEHRIIEDNARKKGATNDQLSTIRRAEEASARDRLRQQKAASVLASSVNSPSNQSTISVVSNQTLSPIPARQPRQATSTLRGLSSSISTHSNGSE